MGHQIDYCIMSRCLIKLLVATRVYINIAQYTYDMIVLSFLGAIGQSQAYFGLGSGPIHLDYVNCSGTEYNLTDCQIGNETRQSIHSEDVGVKCQTCKDIF